MNDHMPAGASLKVGDRVKFKDDGAAGTIRYKGEPAFAKGQWIGVELDEANGKNDGEVKGTRYFTCPANYGKFCKADKLSKVRYTLCTLILQINIMYGEWVNVLFT